MKKQITLAILLCTISLSSYPQTINVDDVEAIPGETTSFTLDLSGVERDLYSAFSFSVQFPIAGFTPTGDCILTSKWNAAIENIGRIDSSGRFFVACASANTLSGPDIDGLITIYFTIDENVATGEYKVTIIEPLFEYGYNGKDYIDNCSFTIHVVASHVQILDETSTTVPKKSDNPVDVCVRRTIAANNWSTICLPFAMTAAQTQEAFGNDVELADFTDYVTEKEGDDIVGITVNFDDVDAIEANHPYIIKVSSDITEFSVSGVEVEPEENPCVEYDNGQAGKKRKVLGTFAGTYVADFDFYNEAKNFPLFLCGNKFYYATEKTQHMKAFRGYFDFEDYLSEAEGAYEVKMAINIDGIQTKVHEIVNEMESGVWYDLSGRRISNRTSFSTLPKGIYIVNGKKTAIK